MTAEDNSLEDVWDKLKQQEQKESLEYLVDRLPALVSSLQAAEDTVAFAMSALQDTQLLRVVANDAEDSVKRLHIDKTHVTAVLDLVHLLPRLVPIIEQVDDLLSFVQSVSTDKRTVDQLIKSATETINTYVPVAEGQHVLEETNERFRNRGDGSDVSIFGLMRMLKDPIVQDGLKYVQTLLAVLNERT